MIVTFASNSSTKPTVRVHSGFPTPTKLVELPFYGGVLPFLDLADDYNNSHWFGRDQSPDAWYQKRPEGLLVLAPRMIDEASVDFVYACWKRKIFGNISMKRVRACMFAANSNGKLFHVFDVCLNDVSPATLKTALSVDYYPGIQEEMSEVLQENFRVLKPNDISPLDVALRATLAKVGVPKDGESHDGDTV